MKERKKSFAHPNVPSIGAMAWCVHSDGSHRARPKSEICQHQRSGVSHGIDGRKQRTSRVGEEETT
jgi:hypothetical protein